MKKYTISYLLILMSSSFAMADGIRCQNITAGYENIIEIKKTGGSPYAALVKIKTHKMMDDINLELKADCYFASKDPFVWSCEGSNFSLRSERLTRNAVAVIFPPESHKAVEVLEDTFLMELFQEDNLTAKMTFKPTECTSL